MTERMYKTSVSSRPVDADAARANVEQTMARRRGNVPAQPEPRDPGFVSQSTGKRVSREEGLKMLTV